MSSSNIPQQRKARTYKVTGINPIWFLDGEHRLKPFSWSLRGPDDASRNRDPLKRCDPIKAKAKL
ncbi:hypothetical protein SISNIDRAFT_483105 [Sistotremastrum niveocremeum HHB9708]|uniref:Uncharacterized protein n=1 Tax=Sistotremastrum niveocremeum HHB9708 TaxID=1314777 RepID=A0A164Y3P2_9AGAM|nr:hypothetical protein SISNIDRAFT_483105 [Sistotremastrum niveocremeum HHB9708]